MYKLKIDQIIKERKQYMRKIILFDMDGVLCDYNKHLLELAHKRLGLPFHNSADVITFNTEKIFGREHEKRVEALSCEPGFFRNLPPTPYAVEAFHEIASHVGEENVFICTAPKKFVKNRLCMEEKSAWVAEHLGERFADRVILTRDKTVVHGHILIDDKPEVEGALTPSFTHVYYDRPYNRSGNRPRIMSWKNWRGTLLPLL